MYLMKRIDNFVPTSQNARVGILFCVSVGLPRCAIDYSLFYTRVTLRIVLLHSKRSFAPDRTRKTDRSRVRCKFARHHTSLADKTPFIAFCEPLLDLASSAQLIVERLYDLRVCFSIW